MRHLLDDDRLNGPQEVRLTYRPERLAVPVPLDDPEQFICAVEYECQVWAGGTSPMLPVQPDGTLVNSYIPLVPGSAVDGILGMHPFDLFALDKARVSLPLAGRGYGRQLAVALLEYREQEKYRALEVVELSESDPWRGIYAACLGRLPDRPDAKILEECRFKPDLGFDDFLRISRKTVVGSIRDLIERLEGGEALTPRQQSLLDLPAVPPLDGTIWGADGIVPQRWDAARSVKADIAVVCSAGSAEDLALLWNLRAAHGDGYRLPIGLPAAELSLEALEAIRHSADHSSGYGYVPPRLCVISASLSAEAMRAVLGDSGEHLSVRDYRDVLTLGHAPGWDRDEVLVWHDGVARIVPAPSDAEHEVFRDRGLVDSLRMHLDVRVPTAPLPTAPDVRIDAVNGEIRAGVSSSWASVRLRTQIKEVAWPSPLLIARALGAARGVQLRESAPGRAGRVALEAIGDIWEVANLAHAPLLDLLEGMAARQGFGWYKERLRALGENVSPSKAVGPTMDELPERSYGDFKKALGNSEKAAKYWLLWAERANLVVKGFQIVCSVCEAKQWIPVSAFAPPIVCRGCGGSIDTPFGDRPTTNFRYKLSERLRRVYEQDAMGHLLVMRYLGALYHGTSERRIIGLHPGIEVLSAGEDTVSGEADVLMLTTQGEFIAAEVKRTFSGLSEEEVRKHEVLSSLLDSPWTILAACQYERSEREIAAQLRGRNEDGTHARVVLSYDHLLEPLPYWALNDDPFEARVLDEVQIAEREKEFVRRLVALADDGDFDWLAATMLRRPRVEAGSEGGPGL